VAVEQREARIRPEVEGVELRLVTLKGREELSRLFRYELELISEDLDIKLKSLLGTAMHVEIDAHDGTTRDLHARVADAALIGTEGPFASYRVTLVPWLWFLDQRRDSRIFQNLTVPDIVKKVLDGHPEVADFDPQTTETYQEREYCVQYRETDFNFVARLMEEEGIYYYFRHSASAHTLVTADNPSHHTARPSYAKVPYYPPQDGRRRERDYLDAWAATARVRPGKATLKAFDFENPRTDLTATETAPLKHQQDQLEVYDYPGSYTKVDHGDQLARLWLEERQADHQRGQGTGNAVGLACGFKFKLDGFPRKDQNIDYLLVSVDTSVALEHPRTRQRVGQDEPYRLRVEALDLKVPFRPARITPRPRVQGPQTAIVTGPAGEEIYTDKYGRVKLRFHWDRNPDGNKDEDSSCWVRVSQSYAGAQWGSIMIPRVGQECIVDFLEGDPDRPIITGRVYNGLAMPPYGLPGAATQSGLKSNSSKGGGGSNELRFEDKKGQEQVYFHAQKDYESVVEHDETRHVKNNRVAKVDVDEDVKVGSNRTRFVGANETVKVGGNFDQKTDGNYIYDLGGNRTFKIGGNDEETVTGNQTVSVTGNQEQSVTGNALLTVTANREVSATASYKLEALTVEITGKTMISLTVGGSYVKIDPSGVTVFGPIVKLN
jgi:type VI secretion system secreted protein VgrG